MHRNRDEPSLICRPVLREFRGLVVDKTGKWEDATEQSGYEVEMEPSVLGRQVTRETIEPKREFDRRRRKASERDENRTGAMEDAGDAA